MNQIHKWFVSRSIAVAMLAVATIGGMAATADADEQRRARIAAAFKKFGIDAKQLATIQDDLVKKGIREDQVEGSLGAMVRMMNARKQRGADWKIGPRVRTYLSTRVGLDDDQIETLIVYTAWLEKQEVKPASDIEAKEAFRKELDALVAKGALTREEATAKMEAWEKDAAAKKAKDAATVTKEDMAAMREQLAKMVAAGEITEEEAKKRWAAYERFAGLDKTKKATPDLATQQKRIEEAVKRGDLTPMEARQKLEALRREAAAKQKDGGRSKAEIEAMKKRLGAAIESGRITEAEAKQRFDAWMKQAAGKAK